MYKTITIAKTRDKDYIIMAKKVNEDLSWKVLDGIKEYDDARYMAEAIQHCFGGVIEDLGKTSFESGKVEFKINT